MTSNAAKTLPAPNLQLTVYPTPLDLPQHLRRHAASIAGTDLANFHHPLFVSIFPLASPLPIEEFLAFRQERANAFLARDELANFVFAHERAYRMNILQRLADDGAFGHSGRQAVKFWRLAAQVWIDAEHAEDNPCWTRLLETPIPLRWAMTKPKDRRALHSMPDLITLYRGAHVFDEDDLHLAARSGWSWTTSLTTARFFARRFLPSRMRPLIITAQVKKADVVAYLTSRDEQEMLIRPGSIGPEDLSIYRD